jgi:hypothetical protein
MEQAASAIVVAAAAPTRPTATQRDWLKRGTDQPGGKLPLFDRHGQRVNERTIRACLEQGWAEPWFANPLMPNWMVCKLTDSGREQVSRA